jgi:hypothetical protein
VAAYLNPLHIDLSTEAVLVEKQTVASTEGLSFGIEGTLDLLEKPFSAAHTRADFAA